VSSDWVQGGLFISFEGIDGAGKSTHIQTLASAFSAAGRHVLCTREPGGTPLAETLRELVLHQRMDALTEALLVFAARRDHIGQVIAPALARGQVVLCDRFTDATFAYQGFGRNFDLQTLSFLERFVQQIRAPEAENASKTDPNLLLQPALTLWFDLAPDIAAQRLASAREPDKFEAQDAAFFTRVRNGYAARQAEQPQRFARIEANASREAVWAQVLRVCQERGFLPGATA
jgi:dTMP kinase